MMKVMILGTNAGMVARIVGWVLRKPVVFTVHGWGFGAGHKRLISALVYATKRLLKHCTAHFITVIKNWHDTSKP